MLFIFTIIFFFLLITESSFAYLDPATGSSVIQALVAVISSISATVIFFYKKIKRFLKKIIFKFKKNFL